jgi:hypothetical protein
MCQLHFHATRIKVGVAHLIEFREAANNIECSVIERFLAQLVDGRITAGETWITSFTQCTTFFDEV